MPRIAFSIPMILALAGPSYAVEPNEILHDPGLEARARSISTGLRCLVCQNESIDDSHADLAHDIRVLVRQRLEAGDTNDQVRDFLVSRYGQFILLRPPVEWQTLLLWGTPLVVLILGGGMIFAASRRKTASEPPSASLSETEKARLDDLVSGREA